MNMKGSRIIVESLLKEKVDTIFCYTGGAVIKLFDDLYTYGSAIRCIQPVHEQGGTHAADAYSRSTGKIGVVLVTSGPGATNTVTEIATAYMDSIPLVVLTGQVPTVKIGSDAFQEADVTGITLPMTKASFLVTRAEDLAEIMKSAFYIARSGRPGPVVVDIPSDVQQQEVEFNYPEKLELKSYNPRTEAHPKQIKSALALLKHAKKPLVISGGGVIHSNATPLLNQFLDKFNIPAVNTLMGYGIDPGDDDLYYAGVGMHGTLYGNYAIQHCDLLIALGMRFSDRIAAHVETFAPNAKIIHVDIDPAEIGKNINPDVPIVGTVRSALESFLKADIDKDHSLWIDELKEFRTANPLDYGENGILKAPDVIRKAGQLFPDDTVVAVDVGQHQMWVAQYYRFRQPRTFLSSSGLGTMGFGLPAAIGAKIGNPDKPVLMISGDGGFQMTLQELGTIKKYDLKVKMLVLDNSYLGMVRQWQELLYEKRYMETQLTNNPDFARIARAFDIKARTLTDMEDLHDAVAELVESDESMLLHAKVSLDDNVFPMVPAGRSLNDILTTFENGIGG